MAASSFAAFPSAASDHAVPEAPNSLPTFGYGVDAGYEWEEASPLLLPAPSASPHVASAAVSTSSPVTLTGSAHTATPTVLSASPAVATFPVTVPVGQVAVNIDPGTGDVLVDVNLQGTADLESVQFKSGTLNAFITANYNGMVAQGFTGWQLSGTPTTRLIAEFNQNSQTPFPTQTVLDFGNFWNTTTNAQNVAFTYNTTPHGGGTVSTFVGTVTYLPVPEPVGLGLAAIVTGGLLGRRRTRGTRRGAS